MAADLGRLVAVSAAAPAPWRVVAVADLDTAEVPRQEWLWAGYIPAGTLTLLGAHGGTGKSTLALMLAVCTAFGLPLFGVPTLAAKVLFFSAEDGADVVRHRLQGICRALDVPADMLADRLHVLDASDGAPGLYREVVDKGVRYGAPTETLEALAEYVSREGIGLLIVDNASDTLEANENDRASVRGFARELVRLVRAHAGAVLLLAHVDKGTSRGERGGTEGYSGSTAWHNSARSRLYLSRSKDGGLLLEHQKCNFGPLREPIRLSWPHGGLPELDAAPTEVVQAIATDNATKALLRLVHEFTERGEMVSTATSGPAHAGKQLRGEPTFPARMRDAEVFDSLRDAERRGWLHRLPYRKANRHPGERWDVTEEGGRFARLASVAPVAPVADVEPTDAGDAGDATAAPVAPVRALGGVGGVTRAQTGAEAGAKAAA